MNRFKIFPGETDLKTVEESPLLVEIGRKVEEIRERFPFAFGRPFAIVITDEGPLEVKPTPDPEETSPVALVLPERMLEPDHEETDEKEYEIRLVHELGHILQGQYFSFNLNRLITNKNPTAEAETAMSIRIMEGFAEYFARECMEMRNPEHHEILCKLAPSEIMTLNEEKLLKKSLAPEESLNPPKTNVGYNKVHVSCYLWMKGYMDRLAARKGIQDKGTLVETALAVFKEAQKKISKDDLEGGKKIIADTIGMAPGKVFNGTALQQEALENLRKDGKAAEVR